jgi:hypothetical protein
MSRSFDRTLKSVKRQLLPERKAPPDFTGWNPADVVQWNLENTDQTLQDMVRADKAAWEKQLKKMEAKRERERRAAEGDARKEAVVASSETKPAPQAEPEAPPPDQPKPEPQWWEERARWRQRGPGDHDWNRPQPGRCLVDYDVLRVDNGYDPFAEFRKKDDT